MLRISRPKLTVLSHFYNEEWLLPHWLDHHARLFDHGILVNYGSKDKSVEIIKNMTPTWELVDSRNQMFDAELCDLEMMEYEEKVQGWKMVLNITEFVFTNNLREKVKQLEAANLSMVRSKGYQINDSEAEKDAGFNNKEPLVLQRFYGYVDPWRFRIIHKHKHGAYYVGRHFGTPGLKRNPYIKEYHKDVPVAENDLYTLWYRFAPFQEQLPRKIQISAKIPDSDKKKGFGWNHWDLNEAKLTARWRDELPKCHDIRKEAGVLQEYEKVKTMYGR